MKIQEETVIQNLAVCIRHIYGMVWLDVCIGYTFSIYCVSITNYCKLIAG